MIEGAKERRYQNQWSTDAANHHHSKLLFPVPPSLVGSGGSGDNYGYVGRGGGSFVGASSEKGRPLSPEGGNHAWARGEGWWGDTPMHVAKPYVVTYAFFRLYHPPSRSMTVARPCVAGNRLELRCFNKDNNM